MSTFICTSARFSNAQKIVEELTETMIPGASGNAIGFWICDSGVDYEQIIASLSLKVGVPIVGGTPQETAAVSGTGPITHL